MAKMSQCQDRKGLVHNSFVSSGSSDFCTWFSVPSRIVSLMFYPFALCFVCNRNPCLWARFPFLSIYIKFIESQFTCVSHETSLMALAPTSLSTCSSVVEHLN